MIHLGTEPRSKAYRLYDPKQQKIVVSRDVHFDETKSWDWNSEAQVYASGNFKVTFSNYGERLLFLINDEPWDFNSAIE